MFLAVPTRLIRSSRWTPTCLSRRGACRASEDRLEFVPGSGPALASLTLSPLTWTFGGFSLWPAGQCVGPISTVEPVRQTPRMQVASTASQRLRRQRTSFTVLTIRAPLSSRLARCNRSYRAATWVRNRSRSSVSFAGVMGAPDAPLPRIKTKTTRKYYTEKVSDF
jgi:hypothetical protein